MNHCRAQRIARKTASYLVASLTHSTVDLAVAPHAETELGSKD